MTTKKKKAAKKATAAAAAAARTTSYRPDNKIKSMPAPPATRRPGETAMSEKIQELEARVSELEAENGELKQKNLDLATMVEELEERANLEGEGANVTPIKQRWTRGKLPGDKLIKTDVATGKFQEIDREEWDSLA